MGIVEAFFENTGVHYLPLFPLNHDPALSDPTLFPPIKSHAYLMLVCGEGKGLLKLTFEQKDRE